MSPLFISPQILGYVHSRLRFRVTTKAPPQTATSTDSKQSLCEHSKWLTANRQQGYLQI